MEAMLQRLFVHKTIPYISKKYINDELADRVLKQTAQSFQRNVLQQSILALDTVCVLKGGAAVAAHMNRRTYPEMPLSDIDVEVYVDDERANVNNLHSFVALRRLEERLRSVCEQYYDEIDSLLANIDMNCLMNNNYSRDRMVIFKSYVNEAVEVEPDKIMFTLNRKMPFKTTVSVVNEDYFLVRHSFNVHMTSRSPMWLHKSNDRQHTLQYFPFDIYFLDLSVKRSPAPYTDNYVLARIYDLDVYVEDLKYLIADQIECLMFNVFNYHWHKIDTRTARIRALAQLIINTEPTAEEQSRYETLKASDERFSVRDVKQILYMLGPLGPRSLLELYFANRFDNDINCVTHQVNFPYHRWESNYYSKCWKRFLTIINSVFGYNYTIQKHKYFQ
nr:maco-A 56 [Mamestra configurata nucleopolyhedrovirus A]